MLAPEEIADGRQITALSSIRPAVGIVAFFRTPAESTRTRIAPYGSCTFESMLASSHPQTGRKILRNKIADTKHNLTGCTRLSILTTVYTRRGNFTQRKSRIATGSVFGSLEDRVLISYFHSVMSIQGFIGLIHSRLPSRHLVVDSNTFQMNLTYQSL